MSEPCRYVDGEPANLPAAAQDALEWLRLLHKQFRLAFPNVKVESEGQARLARCIGALETQLQPHAQQPPIYETAPAFCDVRIDGYTAEDLAALNGIREDQEASWGDHEEGEL